MLYNSITTWKKRVEEKRMLYKTYMALNHYKLTLMCRHFLALKSAPQKTYAVNKLVSVLQTLALDDPFTQLMKVCATQKLRVR